MACALTFFIITLIIVAVLLLLATRQRILLKLGLKNAVRRRIQIVLVVAGLMIGTAMISGSLMMGDTLNYYFKKGVYDGLYLIDERIHVSSMNPEETYFPYTWFTSLHENLSNEQMIDGLAPRLQESLPVRDTRTMYGESSLRILGIVPAYDNAFGKMRTIEGDVVDGSELSAWECYLTEKSAAKIEARAGDVLNIFYKGSAWNVTLKGIVKNEGKLNSDALVLHLTTFQNITGRYGKINQICVSNKGGVEDGYVHSDLVQSILLEKLNATITAEDAGIVVQDAEPSYRTEDLGNNTTGILLYAPGNLKETLKASNISCSSGIYTNFFDFSLPAFLREVYVNLTPLGINMSVPVNTTAMDSDDVQFGNYTDVFGNNISDVASGEIIVVNNFNINMSRAFSTPLPAQMYEVSIEYLGIPDYTPKSRNFTVKSIVEPAGRGNFLNATIIFNYTDACEMFGSVVNAYRVSTPAMKARELLEGIVFSQPVIVKSQTRMLSRDFVNGTLSALSNASIAFNASTGIYTDVMSPQPYTLKTVFVNYTLPNGTAIPLPLNTLAVQNGTFTLLDSAWNHADISTILGANSTSGNTTPGIALGMLSAMPSSNLKISYITLTGEIKNENITLKSRLPLNSWNSVANTTLILRYEDALRLYSLENGSVNFIRFEINFADKSARVSFENTLQQILDNLTTNDTVGLKVDKVKEDNLKSTEEASTMISSIFLMLDGFTISAGIVLIILIFYLLAEERKSELGISRALGMQRTQLVQMFLYEGFIYTLLSSICGAIGGIGLGYAMIYLFTLTFGNAYGFVSFTITPHVEIDSLLLAFSAGILITLLTVFLAAYNISKLNIVSAIRDIPAPKEQHVKMRDMAMGGAGIVAGLLLLIYALPDLTRDYAGTALILGPFLLLFGCAIIIARKFGHERLVFSSASLVTILYLMYPLDIPTNGFGFDLFITTGICIVFSGVILLMYNIRVVLSALTRVLRKTRSKTLPAVIKIAILYPMAKKMRTATTLFMFAIVIFSVTMLAMITGMQTGTVNKMIEDNSGGFDIFGFTDEDNPINDIHALIAQNHNLSAADFKYIASMSTGYGFIYPANGSIENATPYTLYGLDNVFFEKNSYTFYAMADGYESPEQIWNAIRNNASLAVVDKNLAYQRDTQMAPSYYGFQHITVNVSDKIRVRGMFGQEAELTVIGILNTQLISGVFTNQNFLANAFNITNKTVFAIGVQDAGRAGEIAKNLEKEFLEYGFRTIVLRDLLEAIVSIAVNIMNLMQIFLGMGLIVGIAGLAIVTLRSVTERRREIGMLRALGFQKGMVLKSFLIEISFTALSGILLGVLFGIIVGYSVYLNSFEEQGVAFTLPSLNLAVIIVISYILSIAFTAFAAIKASRIKPAEALRYIE